MGLYESLVKFLELLGLSVEPLMVAYDIRGKTDIGSQVTNDAGPQYSGDVTGILGDYGFFDGSSFIKVSNSEEIYSENFSIFMVYEKTNIDSTVLFSSLKSINGILHGFTIGTTSNNSLYLEFHGEDGPVVCVSPYIFGKKNLICVTKFEGTILLHLHDLSTGESLTESLLIDRNHFLPSHDWYIGGSPLLEEDTPNFTGYIDSFVYFNEHLNDAVVREIFKGFYSKPDENAFVKVNEISTQSFSGLTADYVSVDLSVDEEVDQYVQKKYLVNNTASINVSLNGVVDSNGIGSIEAVVSGVVRRVENQVQEVRRYIKKTIEQRVVSQETLELGKVADESKNILVINGVQNVYEDVEVTEEVNQSDDWDEEIVEIQEVAVQVEDDVYEEIQFEISGLEPNTSYSIDSDYTSNGGWIVNSVKVVEYTDLSIQPTPITIRKRSQEFFETNRRATIIDEDYVKEFGFDYISILQYPELGYSLFELQDDNIQHGMFAEFSPSRNDFIVDNVLVDNRVSIFRNGVLQTTKGRNETVDPYQNVTIEVLGDFVIQENVVLTPEIAFETDKLFYDKGSSFVQYVDIEDWDDLPSINTTQRLFFMNGQLLKEDVDYTSSGGVFVPSVELSQITGTLSVFQRYILQVDEISRNQLLAERVKRGSAIVFLNGIRVNPNDVVLHTSVDLIGGSIISNTGSDSILNEDNDRIEFWEE